MTHIFSLENKKPEEIPNSDRVIRNKSISRAAALSQPGERSSLTGGSHARLVVTGENICNISLNTTFLAADADEPVTMEHLMKAVKKKFAKIEKPLSETRIGRWI